MQNSRDSSLWRSLAVAFGDGLAFGVGMKLTQAAGRQLAAPLASAPVRSDSNPLAGRIEQIEQNLKRIERAPAAASGAVDQKVLDAILAAIEARLTEQSGQMERRLADFDARIATELRSLDQRDNSLAQQISGDLGELQQQMVGLNHEFGDVVARIVAEQVESQVRARAAALEQSLPARIALAVEAAVEPRLSATRRALHESVAAVIADEVASQVQSHVASEEEFRAELEQKDREIAELRQRLADTDTNVLDLVLGIGEICRQAAAKISPPTAPTAPLARAKAVADPPVGGWEERQYDSPLPGFAQAPKPDRLWRVPLVSSLGLTTVGLVLRHFLF